MTTAVGPHPVPNPTRFGPFFNVRMRTGVMTVRIAAIVSVEPAWDDADTQRLHPGSLIRLLSGGKYWTQHHHHQWMAVLKAAYPDAPYAQTPAEVTPADRPATSPLIPVAQLVG